MINFKSGKKRWNKLTAGSSYLRNFLLALDNYEINKREDKGETVPVGYGRYAGTFVKRVNPGL